MNSPGVQTAVNDVVSGAAPMPTVPDYNQVLNDASNYYLAHGGTQANVDAYNAAHPDQNVVDVSRDAANWYAGQTSDDETLTPAQRDKNVINYFRPPSDNDVAPPITPSPRQTIDPSKDPGVIARNAARKAGSNAVTDSGDLASVGPGPEERARWGLAPLDAPVYQGDPNGPAVWSDGTPFTGAPYAKPVTPAPAPTTPTVPEGKGVPETWEEYKTRMKNKTPAITPAPGITPPTTYAPVS